MKEDKIKINSLSGKSKIKIVYLVLVEDVTKKEKCRAFVGEHESDANVSLLIIRGYEIKWSNKEKITNYEDALKYVNEFNKSPEDIIEIKYPWHRVISIINVSYKRKDLKQGE